MQIIGKWMHCSVEIHQMQQTNCWNGSLYHVGSVQMHQNWYADYTYRSKSASSGPGNHYRDIRNEQQRQMHKMLLSILWSASNSVWWDVEGPKETGVLLKKWLWIKTHRAHMMKACADFASLYVLDVGVKINHRRAINTDEKMFFFLGTRRIGDTKTSADISVTFFYCFGKIPQPRQLLSVYHGGEHDSEQGVWQQKLRVKNSHI